MDKRAISRLCAFHIFEGLQEGLSHFSGPSRIAVIFANQPWNSMRIYDPQNLLRGHEPKLKKLYVDSEEWRKGHMLSRDQLETSEQPEPLKDPELAGLISCGGMSRSLFFQMWFTEHHPDMCSIGPTQRWLEHAVWLLANEAINPTTCQIGTSGYVLREYATHAVRDCIVDETNRILGMDVQMRNYPILDAVLEISKTVEEGRWPRGKLVFVEPRFLSELDFLARFPADEQAQLDNFKHVRKLLQSVETSDLMLVSDGKTIVGIATGKLPKCPIIADFRDGAGFLYLNDTLICSFYDGRFHSSTRKARLVQLEELFIDAGIADDDQHTLFKIISEIVHNAENCKIGCTLVVDLNEPHINMSGQHLERPLDLKNEKFLELAKSLSRLDGAIHICSDLKLYGFGCILDGKSIAVEDRARGARFNSALRFTAGHENIVVIVVSSDRPVSIIQEGVELNAQCQLKSIASGIPDACALNKWLEN